MSLTREVVRKHLDTHFHRKALRYTRNCSAKFKRAESIAKMSEPICVGKSNFNSGEDKTMEDSMSKKKQARLLEVAEQLKQEMKGVTEEEWVQAIKNSRKTRK